MAPGFLSDKDNFDNDRENFQRPIFRLLNVPSQVECDGIRSLPDLLEFNDKNNATHLFALQQVKTDGEHVRFNNVTFRALMHAVEGCAEWTTNKLSRAPVDASRDVSSEKSRPVALFLESDLTLLVHFCALLWMEIPVCLVLYFNLFKGERALII